jgi:hypothetical protein
MDLSEVKNKNGATPLVTELAAVLQNSDPSGVTPSFTYYLPDFCVTQSP